MDWNNDGRVDAHDYAHYKSVIDTDSGSSGSAYSGDSSGAKWIVGLIIVYVILKLMGLD